MAETNCTNLTLWNNLVVGHYDSPTAKCSRRLDQGEFDVSNKDPNKLSVYGVYANDSQITTFNITVLPDYINGLDLQNNQLTQIPFFRANNLSEFMLSANPISSFNDIYVPPSVQSLVLSYTNIDKFDNVTLPKSFCSLQMESSKVKFIRGVRFPVTTTYINLYDNPVEEFEIAQSDVPVFAQLSHLDVDIKNTTCRNKHATLQQFQFRNICVLPDQEWNALYQPFPLTISNSTAEDSTSTSPPSTTKPTDSSSSATTIGIAVAVAVLLLVGLVGFLYRRKTITGSKTNNQATSGTAESGDSEFQNISSPSQRKDEVWCDEVLANTRISLQDIQEEGLLGQGAFGEVYKGTCGGEVVAIKKLKKEFRQNNKYLQSFVKEAKLMASLDHPNLVAYIGIAGVNLNNLMVVFEFMDGGDLRNLLVKYKAMGCPTGFTRERLKIAFDIANALMYLHCLEPRVLHRDLKSHNVLLNQQLQAKLTDFGIAREQSDVMTAGIGTRQWMAPEVMTGGQYDERSDIFSFGVVLSELDTLDLPYANHTDENGRKLNDAALLERISRGAISVEFTETKLVEVVHLAQECVRLDPASRPAAAEVLYRLQQVIKACNKKRGRPPTTTVDSHVS